VTNFSHSDIKQNSGVGGLVDATPQNPQPCKILWWSAECRRYPRSTICAPPKSGLKFTKIFRGCNFTKHLTVQNFVAIGWKNAGDIRDREFVLPEKVGQSSPKIFRGCYPQGPLIMPNFNEIGQTSLEIGVGRKKISTHRQTDWHTASWLVELHLPACERRD